MTWFDIVVLGVLGISILLGVLRGLVKEVMALVSWFAAFMLARKFGPALAAFVPQTVQPAELRLAVGFVIVLFGVLLVLWVATFLVTELIKSSALSAANRMMGAVFGLVRGLFIVAVGVIVAGLTSVPQHPGWRNAWLSPPFEAIAMSAKAWLPDTIKANVRYDTD